MTLLYLFLANIMTSPLRLRLGAEGELLGWLIVGPYPNSGALEGHPAGFDTDYLTLPKPSSPTREGSSGEANVKPIKGALAGEEKPWRFVIADRRQGLDLKRLMGTNDPGVAYCYASVECLRPVRAHLKFGSDDGAKVYVNGRLVFAKDVKRGVKRDEEDVPIDLSAGPNRLLFKVEQYDGGWGLLARIVDASGNRPAGLHELLEVNPNLKDAANPERSFAGKPGSLDVEAAQEYRRQRADAVRFVDRLRDRIDKPDRISHVLTVADAAVGSHMDNADRASDAFRESFERIAHAYADARAPLLKWAQAPGPFTDVDPKHESYVKVMPGGRYFVDEKGSPFIPIACNHNPDWPEFEESNPLGRTYDPERTDAWFAQMEAHGLNLVRLMVETPPSGNLESPVGTFVPEHVIWLDHIVAAARKHHIRLWITPYDTFWMSLRKETSPYWAENGGPIVHPIDFLTKPAILEDQRRRIKYLIDRYGNLDTVFAWEVMNEIDLWWDASPEQIRDWTNQMVSFVREYEHRRWGRNHMVTISFANPEPKGLNAETAFRRPDLDFATMHLYLGASRGPKPGQANQAGIDFAAGVRYAREQVRDNRPVMDGESGPIDHWIDDERFDDEVFHEMSWQHLMAGGAGAGTRWPYRNPHHITIGMMDTLQAMREFCDGVDWRALTGPAVEVLAHSPEGARIGTFATERGLIGWLRVDPNSQDRAFSLAWRHFARFRFFDIRRRQWLECKVKHDGARVRVELPTNHDEVAVTALRK